MVRQRLFNDIFMDDLNVDSINIRGGQTSLIPHVYVTDASGVDVTKIFIGAVSQTALNQTATDGTAPSNIYDIYVYDNTGGSVNGNLVKNTAYQYYNNKWYEVKNSMMIIKDNTPGFVYDYNPDNATKLVRHTATANDATGKYVFLDLITMVARKIIVTNTGGATIDFNVTNLANSITNAVMPGDYIGVRTANANINNANIFKYVDTKIGFTYADLNIKKHDIINLLQKNGVNNDTKHASAKADGAALGTSIVHNNANKLKNKVEFDFALNSDITGNVTGNLTGNVTGNCSGTAATVTVAAQPNITTMAGLTAAGTAGTNTVFAGPIVASQGVTGNAATATALKVDTTATAIAQNAGINMSTVASNKITIGGGGNSTNALTGGVLGQIIYVTANAAGTATVGGAAAIPANKTGVLLVTGATSATKIAQSP
jgi:hypothetical protein